MNESQKEEKTKRKISHLKDEVHAARKEVEKLKKRIDEITAAQGIVLDEALQSDLLDVMKNNHVKVHQEFPEGTFQRIFWDQQLQAAKIGNLRQMRWHPCMIKWCLNLRLISSAAYHAMRSSGFITLPSERTLRDYTNYIKGRLGFQPQVLEMLQKESNVNGLPETRRYVMLSLDEMKIKEDIVYDKNTGEMIGFINLGDINNAIQDLQRDNTVDHPPVATHLLTLMVRGIFTKLEFPIAHFGTDNLTSGTLFPIVWEGVQHLEEMGFRVMGITADGASHNRKFFRMHKASNSDSSYVYKTENPFSEEERFIYFFSDPPHLIKTARNCLSHSHGHGYTRKLWVIY